MKKFVLCLSLIFLITSVNVFALSDEISCVNDGQGKTAITGEAEENELVTVRIFKKKNHLDKNGEFSLEKAKSDLAASALKGNIPSVLCFADQTIANDENEYSFTAKISKLIDSDGNETDDAVSEVYVVVLASADDEKIVEYLFVDPLERADDYRTLAQMKADKKEDVLDFLEGHKYALGIYSHLMEEADCDKIYSMMYDYLTDVEFDIADATDDSDNEEKNTAAMAELQKTLVIEALNQDKVESIKGYENELMISSSEVGLWYKKSLVDDEFKLEVTERLSRKSLDDISDFDAAFEEAFVLEFLAFSDGLDDCMDIIEAFKTDIGFDEDDTISEEAVRSVMGDDLDNYSALKKELNKYKSDDDDDDKRGSSGGGRGGSSGGGSASGVKMNDAVLPSASQTETEKPADSKFSDLDKAPYAIEAINYLSEKGIISGRGDGTFAPNDNVTRAEFVKILVNAFGFTDQAEIAFSDVNQDSWYHSFVKIAVGSGIANGMSSDYFGASENIIRQDMAVMLYNASKMAGVIETADGKVDFTDGSDISDYASEAVNTLNSMGIINGFEDGSFGPKALATRAQAAKIVYELLNK